MHFSLWYLKCSLSYLPVNQLGFILRLRHGTEWFNDSGGKATRCRGNQQKRQKHWQNMIIESIANVTGNKEIVPYLLEFTNDFLYTCLGFIRRQSQVD